MFSEIFKNICQNYILYNMIVMFGSNLNKQIVGPMSGNIGYLGLQTADQGRLMFLCLSVCI